MTNTIDEDLSFDILYEILMNSETSIDTIGQMMSNIKTNEIRGILCDLNYWYNRVTIYDDWTDDQKEMIRIIGDSQLYRFQTMMQNNWRISEDFRKGISGDAFAEIAKRSNLHILIDANIHVKEDPNNHIYIDTITA